VYSSGEQGWQTGVIERVPAGVEDLELLLIDEKVTPEAAWWKPCGLPLVAQLGCAPPDRGLHTSLPGNRTWVHHLEPSTACFCLRILP
jgi:hypothetical protein